MGLVIKRNDLRIIYEIFGDIDNCPGVSTARVNNACADLRLLITWGEIWGYKREIKI